MEIEVTIKSRLSNSDGGSATLRICLEKTVLDLINEFCKEKGVLFNRNLILNNKDLVPLDSSATLSDSGIRNGEVLFISSNDDNTVVFCFRGCNQWWALAVIIFLIGVCGIITVSILRVKSKSQPDDYAVVFDAGSSHTQLFVYKWPADKNNGTGVVQQLYTERAKGGGISNYTEDPSLAGKSIEPLLNSAEKHVPSNMHDSTPVFLGATAGMRLLVASDNTTAQEILASVRHSFSKYSFTFTNQEKQVRVLDGAEEGIFSWVTVNFLQKSFFQYSYLWNSLMGYIPQYTYGALDLGGASTQITFIPEHFVLPDYAETVTMYGRDYTAYSHSYLCYGLNEAQRQLFAHLVRNALMEDANATVITNPCQPTGNQTVLPFSEIFEAPCTNHLAPSSSYQSTSFTFVGSSDSNGCSNITHQIFDFENNNCSFPPCAFNNVHQPPVYGNFYAFSGYWNTMSFLNTTNSSLAEFEHARDSFCAKSWTEISGMPSRPVFLVKYCFDAHYVHSILVRGYKFTEHKWPTLHFQQKIDGNDLGWSLGFTLNATNRFPERHPTTYITLAVFVLLLLFFIIFLGIAAGFACHARQRKAADKDSSSYERLQSYGAI